jgi:5-(carboxyamino)imidazole ribonucleotide mutase
LAIGAAGAYNAALLAIQVLALHDDTIATKLDQMRQSQTETILASPTPGIINP